MVFNCPRNKKLVNITDDLPVRIALHAAPMGQDEHSPAGKSKIADAGYFGMTFPSRYGGQRPSALDAVLVIEEAARHCSINGGKLIVDHNFRAASPLIRNGGATAASCRHLQRRNP